MNQKNSTAYKIALTGLIAALSYVVFTFLQIKIMIPGTESATSIHLGNAVCVLGALLLGGPLGGIGGAVGMTIGDLLDPIYITSAPKTFILKLCIGLITGLVAHKFGRLSACTDSKKAFKWSLIAAVCGLAFNMVFDPLFSYFYKLIILGKPAAELTLLPNIAATTINAVTSAIVSVAVYNALRPALKKAGLLPVVGKSEK
ncbi:MAG: ECF transporter S component [Lachnospiraceae bacterium]|nr:ECF transporter S component [Lachnospiraceae bacterium]